MTSEGLRFTDADGSRRLDTAIAADRGGVAGGVPPVRFALIASVIGSDDRHAEHAKEDLVVDDARELILQDVRCFQDEQRGRLRPITLLVGENSTGKTTFLGCYRVLHRTFSELWMAEFLDFNEEPFAMGSFRDIVRSRRGPSGRIDEFTGSGSIRHRTTPCRRMNCRSLFTKKVRSPSPRPCVFNSIPMPFWS